MLQQSNSLSFDKTNNHVAQHRSNSVESLVCGTDISKAGVIKQNFLNDEDGHCFRELTSGLHDPQTQRYDLGGQEKCDRWRGVASLAVRIRRPIGVHGDSRTRLVLDQRTNDPK